MLERSRRALLSALMSTLPARCVGVLFVLAAVLKVYNPEAVVPAVRVLFDVNAAVVVAGVVICEVMLGVWLVVFPGVVWIRAASALALLGFSGALLILLGSDDPPTCGCFGKLVEWRSARTELWFGVGRNAVLLACVLPAPLRVSSVAGG